MSSVVIIDDESDLVSTMSDYFVIQNIDVLATGNNGKDAVELCLKHSPDYLLLDLNMPNYDGFYALEKLYEISSSKIIVISGSTTENLTKLQNYKGITVIKKPFVAHDVAKLIQGKKIKIPLRK